MLTKCCLCIDLKNGTRTLALLGAIQNFFQILRVVFLTKEKFNVGYFILTVYLLANFALCTIGFIGTLKNKLNYVKIFAYYYWIYFFLELLFSIVYSAAVLQLERDLCQKLPTEDREECMRSYIGSIWATVFAFGIVSLIQLHFCLAVWAYYQNLRSEYDSVDTHDSERVIPPATYDSTPARTYGSTTGSSG
ncbi:3764_t:CDS:2 [Ambispora leptoticha]|uniref:3764_t:CDS:1 n=1 Tax=Ambispora leptoticha TaxID=144679 RepID=A0A9N9BIS2_9GLOM|nr:3764_t:CDS:2 [Ambispora leptoticha]